MQPHAQSESPHDATNVPEGTSSSLKRQREAAALEVMPRPNKSLRTENGSIKPHRELEISPSFTGKSSCQPLPLATPTITEATAPKKTVDEVIAGPSVLYLSGVTADATETDSAIVVPDEHVCSSVSAEHGTFGESTVMAPPKVSGTSVFGNEQEFIVR